jgi:SPP1 family holin
MKTFIEKLKSLDKGTVIRTIALILALANQTVAIIGATSFANEVWYQVTSLVVTIATALFTGWKNNDFTYFAKLATGVLRALQDGRITEDEVKGLLEKGEEK